MAPMAYNIYQRITPLILSAIILLGTIATPTSSTLCIALVTPTAEHILREDKCDVAIYQCIEQFNVPTVKAEQHIATKLPHLPLALCCSASKWSERVMAQRQHSYRLKEQAIVLSAPSWLLIFPFNAFW